MIIGNNIQANHPSYNFRRTGLGNSQDAQLKSIQDQITRVQKEMQKLAENKGMSLEQKMDKKKELEQQLQDLNKQALQRQSEIQKEQKAPKTQQQESMQNSQESDADSMGAAKMQGIISAATAMAQVKTLGTVKNNMEGQAGVLGIEIKLDQERGASVEHKEAKLADLQDKINSTASNMMKQISDVDKTLEESKNSTQDTIDKKDTNKEKAAGKKISNSETNLVKNEEGSSKEEKLITGAEQSEMNQKANYIPIDLRV
jgi:hypothetical protein